MPNRRAESISIDEAKKCRNVFLAVWVKQRYEFKYRGIWRGEFNLLSRYADENQKQRDHCHKQEGFIRGDSDRMVVVTHETSV